MMALAKRVIRQIWGDKRTLALIMFAPILILTLLNFLLGNSEYIPTIALDSDSFPPALTEVLHEQHNSNILNISVDSDFDATSFLKENREVDAVWLRGPEGMEVVLYEASTKSSAAMQVIQNTLSALNPAADMEISFVIGQVDEALFDTMGFAFLSIISFFLIFIVSGMALVRERSAGTLERLLMTPIKRGSVVAGYTMGYGFFAMIQAVILVVISIFVLGMRSEGPVIWVIITMLLLAMTAVAFGKFLSIFANTEFQVVQFIPIAIIPQVFFSGIIPLETFPGPMGNLAYIMPIFYGGSAIREVMRAGHGFLEIWPYLLALLAYLFILSFLNTQALKKYRRL